MVHGARVERRDLVGIEIGGDEGLGAVFIRNGHEIFFGHPVLLHPLAIRLEVAADAAHRVANVAEQFKAAGIPFIFDPGQAMPLFEGDDFRRFITIADWLAVNDYEWALLQERTGWSVAECTKHVKALIITRGSEGSVIHANGKAYEIPCARAKEVVDPTGCGDAYRAGLVHGILHGLDWETTGRIASLMGAIKIAVRGTQNHTFTKPEFDALYAREFGAPLRAAS